MNRTTCLNPTCGESTPHSQTGYCAACGFPLEGTARGTDEIDAAHESQLRVGSNGKVIFDDTDRNAEE